MDTRSLVSIQCLPEEVFECIAEYLNSNDIDACFNVSCAWRHYFNRNKIWKKCCIHPENFFSNDVSNFASVGGTNKDNCVWRQCYEYEQKICDNFSKGNFIIEKSNILKSQIEFLYKNVDNYGEHWLFDLNHATSKIIVYNFTKTLMLHQEVHERDDLYQIWPLNDKVLAYRSNYIKVYLFRYPKYELKLQYHFQFEMNEVFAVDEVIHRDNYSHGARFVCVGRFFVGCYENITNIHRAMLHIWDLDSAKKIVTKSVYQQSFADFVLSKSGRSVASKFKGGLLLFKGSDTQFLITLIDDTSQLCQVTLFDTDSMSFSTVIAQLKSRTAWCSMKKDVVVIYHPNEITSQLSVYDIKGIYLANFDLPSISNPMFRDEFWFNGSLILLNVSGKIEILSINSHKKVSTSSFIIGKNIAILNYHPPKFLLCYDKSPKTSDINSSLLVNVWDIEQGTKLWTLPELSPTYSYLLLMKNTFPYRLLVNLKNDNELSTLKFELN